MNIYALSRSGCHAVVHWIASHRPGRCVIENRVKEHCYGLEVYLSGQPQGNQGRAPRLGNHFDEREVDEVVGDSRIVLWEELPPAGETPVVVLRDPLNWLASRLFQQGRFDKLQPQIILWSLFAEEWKRLQTVEGAICISYPEWFLSREYRDTVARRLGFHNLDRGIEKVSRGGGGSSFDRLTLDGHAQNMRVLDRWSALLECEEFRQLLTSLVLQGCLELGRNLFGHVPQVCVGLEGAKVA